MCKTIQFDWHKHVYYYYCCTVAAVSVALLCAITVLFCVACKFVFLPVHGLAVLRAVAYRQAPPTFFELPGL
jgi:hypothetical protein